MSRLRKTYRVKINATRAFIKKSLSQFAFSASAIAAVILVLGYSQISHSTEAGESTRPISLHVAVASNFNRPFEELKTAFEHTTPYTLITSYGSTGQLYAQIVQGAPFDVFLSADRKRPENLIQKGLASKKGSLLYARGRLALYAPDHDANKLLHSPQLNLKTRLTLANPKLAPYGAAAMSLMQTLNVWEDWKKRSIRGQNIHQTFQFLISGNAQLGFIAYSQVSEKKHGSTLWLPPTTSYPPLWQQAVIIERKEPKRHLHSNKQPKSEIAALAFLTFLQSDTAKTIIKRHGYLLDDNHQNQTSTLTEHKKVF